MSKPKKWTDVYPYGTKEGDEEAKFFRALARHPKYDYRSTGAIIKATGLPRQRVEEIVDKYVNKVKPPLLFAHPTNDDHWGYWERCQDRLDDDKRDISKKDKDNRVDKHLAGTPSMVGSLGVDDTLAADMQYFKERLMSPMTYPLDLLNQAKLEIFAELPCGLMVQIPEQAEMLDWPDHCLVDPDGQWTLDV